MDRQLRAHKLLGDRTMASPSTSPPLPNPVTRIASAVLGAFLTSAFVTPLDVVKTRLQAPRLAAGASVPSSTLGALAGIGMPPHFFTQFCVSLQ